MDACPGSMSAWGYFLGLSLRQLHDRCIRRTKLLGELHECSRLVRPEHDGIHLEIDKFLHLRAIEVEPDFDRRFLW